ncbi:hypothetical protein NDU88_001286 [Pleurodeles waltl]|uniref:Uncharacterized protein n=1 Tax=Pleurodeles waltl TaxID=8319 RepID=A0AAV7NAL7_PLEWA|nr:hypothetical protein NDU88_001286 [Pleurodeles waltl]
MMLGGGRRHPTTTPASRAVRIEDRRPILGFRPRQSRRTARGRRKGLLRAPRPLPRAAASPAARLGDAEGRRGATEKGKVDMASP